jgi:hypothetical protein
VRAKGRAFSSRGLLARLARARSLAERISASSRRRVPAGHFTARAGSPPVTGAGWLPGMPRGRQPVPGGPSHADVRSHRRPWAEDAGPVPKAYRPAPHEQPWLRGRGAIVCSSRQPDMPSRRQPGWCPAARPAAAGTPLHRSPPWGNASMRWHLRTGCGSKPTRNEPGQRVWRSHHRPTNGSTRGTNP